MCLWPSRGLAITGIEVKSFRSDWLRELKQPEKAEGIFKFCDYWYLVTTTTEVAKLEEIPETWGWMALKGTKLVTMKEAPKLEAQPLSRHFVAAMLKRATQGMVPESEVAAKIKEGAETMAARNKSYAQENMDRVSKMYKELQEKVRDFEQASGVQINRYSSGNAKDIGEAVRLVLSGGLSSHVTGLRNATDQLKRIADRAQKTLETVELLHPESI